MKVYMGFRIGGMSYAYVWDAEQPSRPERLNSRLDLWNHSPTGFEWGYMGSGPAQLALAIAADVLGDDAQAVAIHQLLKGPVQEGWGRDCWSMTADRLLEIIASIKATPQWQRISDRLASQESETGGAC